MSAGGQGSVDKALIAFRSRPLVAHVIARIRPQVSALLLNANRSLADYSGFGYPVIADTIQGYPGPLAGLHAALLNARTPWVQIVPCDSPFLPIDLVSRLADGLSNQRSRIALARTVTGLQPVFALVHRELAPDLQHYLDTGGRKIDRWYQQHNAVLVDFDDENAFVNLNTPEELNRLEACP